MEKVCPQCGTVYGDDLVFCGQDGKLLVEQQASGDQDARIGEQLGDYLVVSRIADGAMGRVYEGRHVETRARVAVKVLHADVQKDAVAVERFKREFETAEELDHPHVVDVVDFGATADGSQYMTMEYLEGEELGELLRRESKVAPARIVRIVCQVAQALAMAHSYGVIHRDLKPDNIFLCRSDAGDDVKILDFGSVKLQMETGPKLTAFGTTLGSPYYMSPEQAMGKQDVDHRSDVFAIAAILHEMATGQVAFHGETLPQILMKIVQQEPDPVSVLAPTFPMAYDDVVANGVRKDKNARTGSIEALAEACIRAFGLEGSVDEWADKPQAEIESALANATPPEPEAYGTASPVIEHTRPSLEDAPVLAKSGPSPVLILGAAVVVLGLIAAAFAFM